MKLIKFSAIALISIASSYLMLCYFSAPIRIEKKFEIKNEQSNVFSAFVDENSIKKWLPQTEKIIMVDGMPYMEGSMELIILDLKGNEIFFYVLLSKFDPFEEIFLEFYNEELGCDLDLKFHENGKSTLVSYTLNIEAKNFLLKPFISGGKSMIENMVDETNNNFKTVVEEL